MHYLMIISLFVTFHEALQYDEAFNEEFNQGFPLAADAAFYEGFGSQTSMIPMPEEESPGYNGKKKEAIPIATTKVNKAAKLTTHSHRSHRKIKGHVTKSTKLHRHTNAAQRNFIEGNPESVVEQGKQMTTDPHQDSVEAPYHATYQTELSNHEAVTMEMPNHENSQTDSSNHETIVADLSSQEAAQVNPLSHEASQVDLSSHESSQIIQFLNGENLKTIEGSKHHVVSTNQNIENEAPDVPTYVNSRMIETTNPEEAQLIETSSEEKSHISSDAILTSQPHNSKQSINKNMHIVENSDLVEQPSQKSIHLVEAPSNENTYVTESSPSNENSQIVESPQQENIVESTSNENTQHAIESTNYESLKSQNSHSVETQPNENGQLDSSSQANFDKEQLTGTSQYYATQLLPGDLPSEKTISDKMMEHEQHEIEEEQPEHQPQRYVSQAELTETGSTRHQIYSHHHHKHQIEHTPRKKHGRLQIHQKKNLTHNFHRNRVIDRHLVASNNKMKVIKEINNNEKFQQTNKLTLNGTTKQVQPNHPSKYQMTNSQTKYIHSKQPIMIVQKSKAKERASIPFKTIPSSRPGEVRYKVKKVQHKSEKQNKLNFSKPVSKLEKTNVLKIKTKAGHNITEDFRKKETKKEIEKKSSKKEQQSTRKGSKIISSKANKRGKECVNYIGCLESWFQKYHVRITSSLDSVEKFKALFSDIYKSDYMISFKSQVKSLVQKLYEMKLINWAIIYNYRPNFASWMNIDFLRMPLALETPSNLQQKVVFQRIMLLKEKQDEIKDKVKSMKNFIVKKRSISAKIQAEVKGLHAQYEFLQDSIENLRDNATISGIYQDEAPAISVSGYDRNSYIWSRCAPKEANGDLYVGMYQRLMDMNSYQCVLYAFMKCIRDMEREERLSGYRIENKKKQGSFERYTYGFTSLIQLHFDYGAKQNKLLPIDKNSSFTQERLTSAYCESLKQVKCLQEDGVTHEDALKFEEGYYCQNYFGCYVTCGEDCFLKERNLLPDERDRLMAWLSNKDAKRQNKAEIELWNECCSNIQNCLPLKPISKKS